MATAIILKFIIPQTILFTFEFFADYFRFGAQECFAIFTFDLTHGYCSRYYKRSKKPQV